MTEENDIARLELLLEETKEIAEENNTLLRGLRRNWRISFWIKVVMWVIILAVPFFLIGPLIEALIPAVGAEQGGAGIFGVPDMQQLQDLINAYQGAGQ